MKLKKFWFVGGARQVPSPKSATVLVVPSGSFSVTFVIELVCERFGTECLATFFMTRKWAYFYLQLLLDIFHLTSN